jgi:hypothetical protein
MNTIRIPVALCALLFISGCNSSARVITDDRDKIITIDQIDVQDWSNAADQLIQQLIASGVLETAPTTPARLEVTRVVNDTTVRVSTDNLTQKIKIALQQTGRVAFTSRDQKAKEVADYRDFKAGDDAPRLPYFVLNGKILEIQATAGRTRQSSFVFQMNLVNTTDNTDAWSGEAQITKKGTRNAVNSRG